MKNRPSSNKQQNFWYPLSLLILAVIALVVTFLPYLAEFGSVWTKRLGIISKAVYIIFMLDFLYFWFKAGFTKKYVCDNWVSLLALFTPYKGLKGLKALKGFKGAVKGVKVLKIIKLGKKVKEKADG